MVNHAMRYSLTKYDTKGIIDKYVSIEYFENPIKLIPELLDYKFFGKRHDLRVAVRDMGKEITMKELILASEKYIMYWGTSKPNAINGWVWEVNV